MEAFRIAGPVRSQLEALLAGDRPESPTLLRRLRELASLDAGPTFAAAVHLLVDVILPEKEAEKALIRLLEHREATSRALGRDPGLRVTAFDYFTRVRGGLANPVAVERTELEQARRCGVVDPLTALGDRRSFLGRVGIELRRLERNPGLLSVLRVDLDAFGPVNDLYGREFGDAVLVRAAGCLRRLLRDSDLAFRTGADEFGVILPCTGRGGARAGGERLRAGLAREFSNRSIERRIVAMTLSAGIATAPDDGRSPFSLLEAATRALGRARRGGDRVVAFSDERRRWPRSTVGGAVSAELRQEDRDRWVPVELLDLGRGGARIGTVVGVESERSVTLSLGGRSALESVRAHVTRFEPGRSRNLVALVFDRPLGADRFRQLVESGEPTSPGEGRDL